MLKAYNISFIKDGSEKTRVIYSESCSDAVRAGRILAPGSSSVSISYFKTFLTFFKSPMLSEDDFVFFAESLYEATEDMGLPYSDAFATLYEAALESNPKVANVCNDIGKLMDVGLSFGEAVESLGVFPSMFADLLPIAETVGKTGYILKKMAEYYGDMAVFKSSVKKELIVPKIQISLAIGVTLYLAMKFVPDLMKSLGEEALRPHIKGIALKVLTLSDMLKDDKAIIIFGIVSIFIGYKVLKRLIVIPEAVWSKLISIPLIGRLISLNSYIYIFSALEVMISNNVPVSESLKKIEKGLGNPYYRDRIAEALPKVEFGESLPEALRSFIDPYAYQVLNIANQAGAIDKRCGSLSKKYAREMDDKLKAVVAYLNPILMLIIGLIIVGLFTTVLGLLDAQKASAMG